MGKSYKRNSKWEELNPDKFARGHKFSKVGRSATFKSKKDYNRKDNKRKFLEDHRTDTGFDFS